MVGMEIGKHVMAKSIYQTEQDDLERLQRNVSHQTGLMTGLSGMAFAIMSLMTWWGLSGAQGSGWQTNWIIGGAIAICLLGLFSLITASNIRRDIEHEIDKARRSVESQDRLIAEANAMRD